MELLVFGDSGTPVLAFPTRTGRFFEWEDHGMIDALSYQIGSGFNQIFCVDSVDEESFSNEEVDPYTRLMRYEQYEAYLIDEVLPYIRYQNPNPFLIIAGAGFGAYYAANLVFKFPDKFGKLVGMDGDYNMEPSLDGFYDDNVYFNNPFRYLARLQDGDIMRSIQQVDLRLAATQGKDHSTRELSDLLLRKFIDHDLDVWEPHEGGWELWQQMIQKHII